MFFAFFSKTTRQIGAKFFFQGLGENTCSLQLALKSNAPGLQRGVAVLAANVTASK